MRTLAIRAGISTSHISDIEAGVPGSLETYARLLSALDLPLELSASRHERQSQRRGQDLVHAAMGELEARQLLHAGFEVAMDEPYQRYQFAGRADVVAWDRARRALLHIENRTQFPNVQEALGSFGSKRAYLGGVLATRIGLEDRRWASETHVIVALWSSEVLNVLRRRETTFRVTCPDASWPFDRWWAGELEGLPSMSSVLVLMDPASEVAERFRFAALGNLPARPRYRDYRDAAERLSSRSSRESKRPREPDH